MVHVKNTSIAFDIIEETIALGEGYKTELREAVPSIEEIARTFCAFANTKGGTLFVGITSSGELKHNPNKYNDLNRIERATSLLSPTPVFAVEAVDFKNHELLLIRVHESKQKPCYVDEEGLKTAYIRTDKGNTTASKKDLKRIISQGNTHGQ
jgi:ATP-dependent DNA helicase RecG